MVDEPGESGPRIFSEPEFRHLLALEVRRSTRYQDFFSLSLAVPDYPGRPDPRITQELARILAESLRSTDAVGLMGEGVGMLLLHTPRTEALDITERIRGQIDRLDFRPTPDHPAVRVALHLGFVSFPEDETNEAALLARAHERLGQPGSGESAAPRTA